jgi:hypothetical protein
MMLSTAIFLIRILPVLLLRSSDSGRLMVYCVVGICGGIYVFFRGFRLLQRRRLILDTPVSKIRSASLGMVELNGLAVGPNTLNSPLTGRACYFFRTNAWEWKREGRSSKWVKVACESMHVPFFVDDNTGKLMVDPRGAELDLHCDFKEEFCDSFFTLRPEAPANVRDFLLRHGISTTNKIKVEEFCIKPKNALFLLGTLAENPGLELTQQPILDDEETTLLGQARLAVAAGVGGNVFSGLSLTGGLQHNPEFDSIYQNAISTASARVTKHSATPAPAKSADMTQQQKIASALVQAGISNPGAWAAAGVTPSAPAIGHNPIGSPLAPGGNLPTPEAPATPEEFDAHPHVVLMKGVNNPTFLISWRSQVDVAKSLGWKCALMIWGGPALSLLSLYVLLLVAYEL